MRSMISGVFTRPSSSRGTLPVSAYGGFAILAGTERIGLMTPCSIRPSVPLWQRLYLRPLPHQHGSFEAGSISGAVFIQQRLRANVAPFVLVGECFDGLESPAVTSNAVSQPVTQSKGGFHVIFVIGKEFLLHASGVTRNNPACGLVPHN